MASALCLILMKASSPVDGFVQKVVGPLRRPAHDPSRLLMAVVGFSAHKSWPGFGCQTVSRENDG